MRVLYILCSVIILDAIGHGSGQYDYEYDFEYDEVEDYSDYDDYSYETTPPIFSVREGITFNVHEGEDVIMPCSVNGNSPYSLIVKKITGEGKNHLLFVGGHKVIKDRRFSLLRDGLLQIRHVNRNDTGSYKCYFDTEPVVELVHKLHMQDSNLVTNISHPTTNITSAAGQCQVNGFCIQNGDRCNGTVEIIHNSCTDQCFCCILTDKASAADQCKVDGFCLQTGDSCNGPVEIIYNSCNDRCVCCKKESPMSLDQCALPVKANLSLEDGFNIEDGVRFGSKKDSWIEYDTLPVDPLGNFNFSFDIKSWAEEGIIFYGSNENHEEYITIYIKDGYMRFSYNDGFGLVILRSNKSIKVNQWHSVLAQRFNNVGVLYIDGLQESNGTRWRGPSTAENIDIKPPYYLGGLRPITWDGPRVADMASRNTEGVDSSLNGCIRDMRVNEKLLTDVSSVFNVVKCSENVDPGIFFGEGVRSHIVLRDRFRIGLTFEISMDIKPRVNTGVLMSVHGRRDFILLQIKHGEVVLSADNGKGISTVTYKPPTPWSLCDGSWHTVEVIKAKNVLVLVVDNIATDPVSGKIGSGTSIDTNHPFFLGTQPRIGQRRGEPTEEKYIGCMKNVKVNKEEVNFASTGFEGNVNAGFCPTI